jgi:signal transduction histidine kinase/GAF domain-containing protein
VVVFLGMAVVLAPLLSSFLDAGLVRWLHGEPYWGTWRARLLSNALTALTVVPAVVNTVVRLPRWRTRGSSRYLEATALALGLAGLTWFLLGPSSGSQALPGVARAPLAFYVPFIAWAAIRFGSSGASLVMLITTVLTISAAARGLSPFRDLPAAETLPGLQLLLIAVSTPLLVLAAVIDERHAALARLDDRLRFETLLSALSQAFLQLPGPAMRQQLGAWLARVGEHFSLDCLLLFQRSADGRSLEPVSGWMQPALGPPPQADPHRDFTWSVSRLLEGAEIAGTVDDLPPDAAGDRGAFARCGVSSGVGLPLVAGDEVVGAFASLAMAPNREWRADLVARLRLVSAVFGQAMARQRSEDALRASESTRSAILGSITSGVAVIDACGCVLALNAHWRGLGCQSGLDCTCLEVGDNLLAACRKSGEDPKARAVMEGLANVLTRRLASFAYQHTDTRGDGPRWWVLTARPLDRPDGGAVVTHTDITDRKRAELEAQVARAELAHVARVSTMGELTSSLAHELNQPLTAVVANAQAGRRLIGREPPPLDELGAIFHDIVQDGHRAGAIIQQTRDLLRKGAPNTTRVDVNVVVTEVAELLRSDAVIKHVSVSLALAPGEAAVRGDHVQLQQVVLNLLMNAFEAMPDDREGDRRVVVSTDCTDAGRVDVSVLDTGTGIQADAATIFDAFYTTKPAGLGMGLSIARSIVEAHGGAIRASNNAGGGATVRFTLPRDLNR